MEYEKLVRLLGGNDPAGMLGRAKSTDVHTDAARMFWKVLMSGPRAELKMHPHLSRTQIAASFREDTPEREKLCGEIDDFLRQEIKLALSGSTPYDFWWAFPTIVGHYLSSGMLAAYVPNIVAEARELTEEYDELSTLERHSLCSLIAQRAEDPLEKLLAYLTNISVDVLKTSEKQIMDLLEARAEDGKIDTRTVAALSKEVEPDADREIRRVALALYLWKRLVLVAVEDTLNPPSPLESMLKSMAASNGLSALFGGMAAEQPDSSDVPEVPEAPEAPETPVN